MKTQIARGSYDNSGVFLVSPVQAGKSARVNGGSRVSQRVSPEPVAAERISACEPARGTSDLPASLKDWLVSSKALEICQKDCDGTDDGNDNWVMTGKRATRAKNPLVLSMRP
jgi:hypothetical protein